MAEKELDYLLRRAAEELECAEASSDTIAAQVHRQMAVLYANQIAELRQLTELEIAGQSALPQPQTPQPQTP